MFSNVLLKIITPEIQQAAWRGVVSSVIMALIGVIALVNSGWQLRAWDPDRPQDRRYRRLRFERVIGIVLLIAGAVCALGFVITVL